MDYVFIKLNVKCFILYMPFFTDIAPDAKRLALAVSRSRGGENVLVMKKCEDLVIELSQRQEAWPFLKPVSRKDVRFFI